MKNIHIIPIGKVFEARQGFAIQLEEKYIKGLIELDGFNHLNILWWAHHLDNNENRSLLTQDKPYKKGPKTIGTFATRSPQRPNPIGLTTIYVLNIDHKKGIVYTPYIDAEPETPVIDIKPYHPCTDLTKDASVPLWCAHWPANIEESASFNWKDEFNF